LVNRLYGIQNLLRAGAEKLTDRRWARLESAIAANERAHLPVSSAWSCAQQLRAVDHHRDPVEGRKMKVKVLATFPSCPRDRPTRTDPGAVARGVPGLLHQQPVQQRRHAPGIRATPRRKGVKVTR
jgi:hypothetical protein